MSIQPTQRVRLYIWAGAAILLFLAGIASSGLHFGSGSGERPIPVRSAQSALAPDGAQSASASSIAIATSTHGVSIDMAPANNVKSQAYAVYKDGKWQAYATTTPLTAADIADMQAQIREQQAEMQRMIDEQRRMFLEQQQMFDRMFGAD